MGDEIDSTVGPLTITADELAGLKPEDILKVLHEFGKAFCMILEFFPSKEITFPHRVSEDCVIEFTVKKK
jgi:hypothetical protein